MPIRPNTAVITASTTLVHPGEPIHKITLTTEQRAEGGPYTYSVSVFQQPHVMDMGVPMPAGAEVYRSESAEDALMRYTLEVTKLLEA